MIVPNASLAYTSIEDLGAEEPTNFILDPQPNRPLTQFVLEKFSIPFQVHPGTGRVLGGTLPGFDIKNQDATTMLKLSLAVELLDPPEGVAGFAELELDEFGVGRFFVVGETAATNLDVRYCIPTTQIRNPADLVIVRGYDPPPKRILRDSFDGLKNAEVLDYKECAADSCDEQAVGKFASISYDDPLLDQVYLDDIQNSYELKAFESLIGYIIDLDLPDGADPDSGNFQEGLKITFGDTTKEYLTVPASILNNSTTTGSIGGIGAGTGAANVSVGFGSESGGRGSVSAATASLTSRQGSCSDTNVSQIGSRIIIPAERFKRLNKFGNLESDFVSVQEVVFSGQKITRLITSPGGGSVEASASLIVKPQKELVSLPQGKNWTWTFDEQRNVILEFLSIVEDAFTATVCQIYLEPGSISAGAVDLSRFTTDNLVQPIAVGDPAFNGAICNIGDRLGYRAVNGRLCVAIERKRPSIDIFDPLGNAGEIARQFLETISSPGSKGIVQDGQVIPNVVRRFGVRYTPVIIVDAPAPIAYAATGQLTNIDGTKTIPAEGIIDQTDGIVDADPTTVQDIEDSELQTLQDNTNGATIDITLPFCTDQECLQIARNFLALQSEIVTTQSIILGPTSEPELGQVLPDGSIVNEINYSYSDSSQYLITVTAGPKFLSAGSFNDSKYQLRTEDVTREGIVVQDRGNGAEYVVRVEGFGELNAVSMILDEITVGDKVNVRIYNNPVERI